MHICDNCFNIIEDGDICDECRLRKSAKELKEEYELSDEEIIERFKYMIYIREDNLKRIIHRLKETSLEFDII